MKLSVAMCTYNGAKFVEDQLLSIIGQDTKVDEIVVCDDGSRDDTIEIVTRITVEHPEISWIVKQNSPNLGVIKNFEEAIRCCSGDIIFLSDQDDVWRKDKTQKVVEYFSDNQDKDIVFSDADIVDEDGIIKTNHSLLEAWSLLPDIDIWNAGLALEIMMLCNRVTGATIAFRKSCVKQFLPFEEDSSYLHDYQIALFGCIHQSIGIINERLIKYRQHGANVQGVSPQNWIYQNSSKRSLLLTEAIEPVPIRHFCRRYNSPRLDFYKKRVDNYCSIKGKLILLGHIKEYIKFYKRYWKVFFCSDMFYGVSAKIRQMFIYLLVDKHE